MRRTILPALVTVVALTLVVRGPVGMLLTLSEAGHQRLQLLVVPTVIGIVLLPVAYGVLKKSTWGWFSGITASIIFLASDIVQTLLGNSQHIAKFIIDTGLVLYFIASRKSFDSFEDELPDIEGESERED